MSTVPERAPDEPDYRFSLANERTFLAWIRTSLALDAAGLALIEIAPDLPIPHGNEILGLLLLGLGTLAALTSFGRWSRNQRAIKADASLPPTSMPITLAIGVSMTSVLAIVMVAALLGR